MAYSPLSIPAIRRGLRVQTIGREIVYLRSVGSTNDWLKAAAAEGAPEGLVVFAEEQSAGRGQAGRAWVAPLGRCLLVSVLLRPSFPPDKLPVLMMLGANAAASAAVALTGLPVQLKWPNDLTSEGRKLGGVLTECSVVDGHIEWAILGIGLNVNLNRHALENIPGASSLQSELGKRVNRNALARALLQGIDDRYQMVNSGQLPAVISEWRARLNTIGQWVTLRIGTNVEGPFFVLQVTDSGGLILRRPNGTTVTAVAGEVSVRPAPVPPPPVGS